MKLLGRLNFLALIISFGVGLLMTYLIKPAPKIIIKFPSPYNVGNVMYRDKSDMCFMYKSEAIACDQEDQKSILPQPLLFEDFRSRSRPNNVLINV